MLQNRHPNRLHRYYGAGYLHFITASCYRRRPLLGTAHNRDLFLQVLEELRRRYRFVIAGYVVMPSMFIYCWANPNAATLRS